MELKMGVFGDTGLPTVEFDNHVRVFGALPPDPELASARMFAPWSAEMPVIPRKEWEETEEDDFGARVLDQDGRGSCTGQMLAMMQEMSWLRAGGKPVNFSACFGYGLCNGGRDAGAVVSDLCQVILETGICTEDEVPEGMIFRNKFPRKAFDVAAKYKAVKVYRITNFDELATALQMRWLVGSGVMVGGNYADLASDGIAPLPSGFGGGGHARCSYALRHVRGQWVTRTRNSWGKRYGMNGDCYEVERMYGRPGTLDAFAIKAIDPGAMDNLPPAPKN